MLACKHPRLAISQTNTNCNKYLQSIESARGGGVWCKVANNIHDARACKRYPNRVMQLTKFTLQNGELVSGEDWHVLQKLSGKNKRLWPPSLGRAYVSSRSLVSHHDTTAHTKKILFTWVPSAITIVRKRRGNAWLCFFGLFSCKEHLVKTEKVWEETQEADGSEEYGPLKHPRAADHCTLYPIWESLLKKSLENVKESTETKTKTERNCSLEDLWPKDCLGSCRCLRI